MQTSDISLWGTAVLMLLTGVAAGLFLLVDRRLGMRLGRLLLVSTFQLAVMGTLAWGVLYLNVWWADVAFLLLVVLAESLLLTYQIRMGWRFLPVLFGAMLVAVLAVGACLLWSLTAVMPYLSHHLLMAVVGLLLVLLHFAVRRGLLIYLGSLRSTTIHRQYMLSCGATHVESVIPSVRRSFRAALLPLMRTMASPAIASLALLFCGMLMCGASPVAAALIVWLFVAATFTSTIITLLLTFYLSDRWLFDQQGNLIVGNP